MKQNQWLCVLVLLAAALSPAGALAIGRVLPQDVKDLSAGVRNCTGRGLYAYTASWTPVTFDNQPVFNYTAEAHNCVTGPVHCTASRCTVEASACKVGAPGAWIAVKTNVGVAGASGVRAPAAPSSRCL